MKNYININLAFMNTNLSILKLNDRTLYRILKKLEDKEYIKRETKSIGNYGKQRKIFISANARLVSSL